ncbi:MAG: galactose-1-phosphate uridylyltransferase [Chloroflexota bacterium]
MPELRQNPLSGRWVVLAAERARRPRDFARPQPAHPVSERDCPFCEGHEAQTPPEVLAYRAAGLPANGPGWTVRVVPNLYPALVPAAAAVAESVPLFPSRAATGAHEVIIASPRHVASAADLPLRQHELVLRAYRDRYLAHQREPGVEYVHIAMNYGREAGASRDHLHAQLFALPLVPPLVESELHNAGAYHAKYGECLLCAMAREELAAGERVVLENDRFVVFIPFAAQSPFELWLVPKGHEPRFEAQDSSGEALLAATLREVLVRLAGVLGDPPFNYWLHTAPPRRPVDAYYHWHLELVPKLGIAAGFELGTDMMINVVCPEQAAALLRPSGAAAALQAERTAAE